MRPKAVLRRVLLLMTDGSNTARLNDEAKYEDWDGIYHWGSSNENDNRVTADALTLEICASVKAAGIRLITVAYAVEDESTKTMLNSCASSGADYYDVKDVSNLSQAFGKIGSGFKDVRSFQLRPLLICRILFRCFRSLA